MPRGGLPAFECDLAARYPRLPAKLRSALARRHGTRTSRVLGDANTVTDLGKAFGHTLYAAEVDYFVAQEWAASADDILWRRTKCGLHLSAEQRAGVAVYLREQYGLE
jgi:glycerol-3-phosphate dehydrogenase